MQILPRTRRTFTNNNFRAYVISLTSGASFGLFQLPLEKTGRCGELTPSPDHLQTGKTEAAKQDKAS
jgi:hypothetical protein